MKSIPHDIWLHIAQFLPPLFLRDLLNVNSTFFNIAMDCRYRQMSFAYLDGRMLRSLERLKDPEVAKRVRILHVYPGFLKEALEKEKAEPLLRRSLRCRLTDLANHLRDQKLFPKYHKFRLIRTFRKTEDVIRVLLDVLGGLPNVTDYFLTWCGLPAVGILPAVPFPFLTAVPQLNLRKLSLDLSLENVQSLLPVPFHAPSLEELHLCIHSESIHSLVERSQIMREHLAPAINQLNSTVKTLVIQSWEPSDLSPLFYTIDHMPALEDLSLCIPVECWHLGNPDGVRDFLNRHRTNLKSLRLRATQFGGIGLTPDLTSLHDWINDAVRGVKLTKLRALDVSSNLFPVDTSVICVHRFSRTITSLSLTGGYRSYDDVERAVNLVADQGREESLGKLRIGLVSLSPQLMDLIATKLPHLFRLDLLVRDIVPFATHQPTYCVAGERASQIDDFLVEMETRRYPFWSLRHLSILVEALPFRTQYEFLLEQTFLRCIPSVVTFT